MNIEALLRQRERQVVRVPMNKTLKATDLLMRSKNVDAVVVTDFCATEGEAVLGVVTRQDVDDAMANQDTASFSRPIAKLKTDKLVYCDVKEPLPDLAGMMLKRAAHFAVVMDHHSVVGLIDASEILSSEPLMTGSAYSSGDH
jgi:signal-transduction protein with cAMP-binding, CBS, and nucleotidyltransferase domain